MASKKWTDEQVEAEIARLKESEYVKLAKREAAFLTTQSTHGTNLDGAAKNS